MTSRFVTVAGFAALFVLAAVAVVLARLRPDLLGRFGGALDAVLARHLVLRLAVLFAWAWLGWHFLARTG